MLSSDFSSIAGDDAGDAVWKRIPKPNLAAAPTKHIHFKFDLFSSYMLFRSIGLIGCQSLVRAIPVSHVEVGADVFNHLGSTRLPPQTRALTSLSLNP